MLLAIDIGNSNLHIGLAEDKGWLSTWRARTVHNKTGDEYAVLLLNFLREVEIDFKAIHKVVIASVVPLLTPTFKEMSVRYFDVEPIIVNASINLGVKVEIDIPEQAGADRLANAAAVVKYYGGGPAIVVDLGTATNFDVVSRGGAYIGGAIAPGIGLAFEALISKAARLYKVELKPPPHAIGRNTDHALQSGIFLGYLGLVEGLITRIKADFPPEDRDHVKVIATGGLAHLFNQQSPLIDRVAEHLTLDGLRAIWEINNGSIG
jgi:type III pantothenate kinase